MPRIDKKHIVRHQANDMFDLVCDIKSYPKFVPLCQSISEDSRSEKEGKVLVVANMTMAYGLLSETFKTRVLMNKTSLTVDVKYIDGPFRHLENRWHFKELSENKCEISFLIDYELRNSMLAMAAGAVFETAFGTFVEAFEARADKVYGKSTIS